MKSLKLLSIGALAVSMAGCVPDWAQENETGIIMEIAGIEGIPGSDAQDPGPTLFSDVASTNNTVINDNAVVTVNIYRKNPSVEATSPLEHVRLESYQVRYFRTDGRNVEGVDVPHRITGPLAGLRFHTPTGTGEIEIEAPIVVVRHTAKREPPLINLVDTTSTPNTRGRLQGEGFLTTVAEITIYARQVTTREPLSATARFEVVFSDFVDE